MQPNLKKAPRSVEASDLILEVIDNVVPAAMAEPAWSVCSGKGWYFGPSSLPNETSGRFWKMDLDANEAYDAIWEHVRARCEAIAGVRLKVLRQYANGHTYGLGGRAHTDDVRPGTFTFLYYSNLIWQDDWDGETVFFDRSGEVSFAVKPRPYRGVLFDSRILHENRAPSRCCSDLRVTVTYTLEAVADDSGDTVAPPHRAAPEPAQEPVANPQKTGLVFEEVSRDGARWSYRARLSAEVVDQGVRQNLAKIGQSVRLPGFGPGKIPHEVLMERYGAQARTDVLRDYGLEILNRLPKTSVASEMRIKSGAQSGDFEAEVVAISLPDLPPVDFSGIVFEHLSAPEEELSKLGVSAEEASAYFRTHLKQQVLDRLDGAYQFHLVPVLIQRELAAIMKAADSLTITPQEMKERRDEFRALAERRVKLGFVIAELGRRNKIRASQGPELEEKVIEHLLAQATVTERAPTAEELQPLAKS